MTHKIALANDIDSTDKKSHGTGFLLNLPGAPGSVVPTAGHNLIGISELKVYMAVPLPQGNNMPSPQDNNLPGFGFNLRLVYQELGKDVKAYEKAMDKVFNNSHKLELHITTFRDGDQPGKPHERSGPLIVRLQKDQLEYGIDTEEAMSGSPVWMVNRGCKCVVAIQ